MKKLICQKCGGEISNDFSNTLLFCTNCGAGLNLTAGEKTLSLADSEKIYTPAAPSGGSKTRKTLLFVIGGFGLFGALVLSGIGFYFFGLPNFTNQYHCTIPGEPEPQTSEDYYNRAGEHVVIAGGDISANIDDCAFGALNEALRLNPHNVDALILRGNGYRQRKQADLAVVDFDKAVQLQPNNIDNYIHRRRFYEHIEKFDKAVEDQTAIINLHLINNPPNNERLVGDYQKRAELSKKIDDFDSAIKDYTEIIRIQPDSVFGYPYRARAFWDKGDFENAAKDYTELIRFEPDQASLYYTRAEAYRKLGKNDLAGADERKWKELRAANN